MNSRNSILYYPKNKTNNMCAAPPQFYIIDHYCPKVSHIEWEELWDAPQFRNLWDVPQFISLYYQEVNYWFSFAIFSPPTAVGFNIV